MRSLKIVVADDEPHNRWYLAELLSRLGHRVTAVADGLALVEACRSSAPDVAVTDWHMPKMDGLRAAAEINRDLCVPVVLLTGSDPADLPAGVLGGCIASVLTKPVAAAELIEALERAAPAVAGAGR